MLKKDTLKWKSVIVAHEIQAHWCSFVLQLLSFTVGLFELCLFWSTQETKAFSYVKFILNKSIEIFENIAPPDLQSDLGKKSGFINLMAKLMTALKNNRV